jgi:hypothetical protein
MNDQELRAVVRDAIARQTAARVAQPATAHVPSIASHHASHALFAVPAGADVGGPCVIEPAVACNHCGYCKSYGH